MASIEKSGTIVVEDSDMYLLGNDDLQNLSGDLVATNSCSFGDEIAPRLAPEAGQTPYGDVWYQPLDTDDIVRSFQSAKTRGMSSIRVRLPVGNKARLKTIYKQYPRVIRHEKKTRRDCYPDYGMRELSDFFRLLESDEVVSSKDAVIQGVILCRN